VPDADLVKTILHGAGVWWAVSLLWVMSYPGSAALWGSVVGRALMGFFIIVPALLAVVWLRLQPQGQLLLLFLFLLVAAADVGAYFAGKAFGKAKLAPKVSPGKSWAGVWGGLIAAVAIAVFANINWPGGMSIALLPFSVLCALAALVSVLGDLTESMVKRHAGVKDSGKILPGHGGIMDRIDGHSAAFPIFALGLTLLGWA
jgi:phosphatidate cytidylyltransferase